MKFKIITLGCKVNQCDSSEISIKLRQAGVMPVKNNADLVIINSCVVTKTAISKAKSLINKSRKDNPKAIILLTGCWPKVYKKEVEEKYFDVVSASRNIEDIVNKSLEILKIKEKINDDLIQISNNDRSRYFVKIQDGCEQFCTYCVIPYARGSLKTRDENDILKEINNAVKSGYKEFVLCGIHVGMYGKSKNEKIETNLVILIKKILKIEGLGRIRLSSIEVNEINDELIKLFAEEDQICKHFHIPLQSGSNRILTLMNRPYSIIYFEEKIKAIRNLIPNIAISTDVIVGFPGESEKEYKESYDFIKKIEFSKVHVFPYSAHEKTISARLPEQNSSETKKMRSFEMNKLGEKLENKFKSKFKNKKVSVVVEKKIGDDKYCGKTSEYFEVEFSKPHDKDYLTTGEIIEVKNWK